MFTRIAGVGELRNCVADPDFVALADPEGNRFCVYDAGH